MNQEKDFGVEAMRGNRLHLGYESIRKKDYTLTKCFEDEPYIRQKFNALWENITAFDTFICKREPTDEECEKSAQVSEDWCRLYLVFFPQQSGAPLVYKGKERPCEQNVPP